MVKKRGFTLAELLAIIVILGILIGLSVPAISNMIKSSKEKKLSSVVSQIKKSAMLNLIHDQKDLAFYMLDSLIGSEGLKSPYGGNLIGYVIVDCMESSGCKIKDYIYEKDGENYKKVKDDGFLSEDETNIVGVVGIDEVLSYENSIHMQKYHYVGLRIEGNDSDLYNKDSNYILKEDGTIKKISEEKHLTINSEYKYNYDGDELDVLVLANDGEKATLLIEDENQYKYLDIGNRMYNIQEDYDIENIRIIDIDDLRARGDDDVYKNNVLDTKINNISPLYGLVRSSTYYWVAKTNCYGYSDCFYALNYDNGNFYLRNNYGEKAKLGLVFETSNYENIIEITD